MRSSLLIVFVFIVACTGKQGSGDSSSTDKIKFEQYLVEGQLLYETHCSNCHQQQGEGLSRLYPPLAKSDYLMDNIQRAICIQKNGQQGEISVNGIVFNQPMPGISSLTNLEIAEITTYITNSWGNSHRRVTIKEVEEALKNCSK